MADERSEKQTQQRVIDFFTNTLGYDYLGNWHYRENNKNVEEALLSNWLVKQKVSRGLINAALKILDKANTIGNSRSLYDANQEIYSLLRYGISVKDEFETHSQTVWLIDWKHPQNNHFAIAEEVTVDSKNNKRPDLVLYVNGIALGVIELKRTDVDVSEGIRQNLDNQTGTFIPHFFTTMQLVLAGNDSQGLRYGTTLTPEKYFLKWKEAELKHDTRYLLDSDLGCLCSKPRFLEIIHDFIVFDAGVKKTCRPNQFFGVKASHQRVKQHENGIIWHTQGSGKSLTMVWLAKWIREKIDNARVLIITDRTELDGQIEGVFAGVDEQIYRTKSGSDLIANLDMTNPWLLCSLVHKFGGFTDKKEQQDEATRDFIAQMQQAAKSGFKPKGNLVIFVDECHRTQSGNLHKAMKKLLPEAMFIGFTGTPLLKKDKKNSVETFGSFIHTYKFDEAVEDGVVLDLRYEARDIDQKLSSQKNIDQWFESKTKGLSNLAKVALKQKWGTMQSLHSSQSRLNKITSDILMDMNTKKDLVEGTANAMLVCSSIYQAFKIYDIFSRTELADKCAVITSYQPSVASIKGEETGEGKTEKQFQYDTCRKMLARFFDCSEDEASGKVAKFEKKVKKLFVKQPKKMKLLIVVDKLLTGFDAPSATYLYIDKKMKDHNLFQAICRVNRVYGEGKDYGYIIDYKDLFQSIDKTIADYTSEAFKDYDKEDVDGLLKGRLEKAKIDLDNALEAVRAICEGVKAPKDREDYYEYFCGLHDNEQEKNDKEPLRLLFYKAVAKLLRAYANIANEMLEAGYNEKQAEKIKQEVKEIESIRSDIKLKSADKVDMKRFEPAMRQLLDMYVEANDAERLIDFGETTMLDLVRQNRTDELPESIKKNKKTMAETIENNVRRAIMDENPINPKYYEKMSVLLDELIKLRQANALEYQEYLQKMADLAEQVKNPGTNKSSYPPSMDTSAKKALFDNLGQDEALVIKLDEAILSNMSHGWSESRFKEKSLRLVINEVLEDFSVEVDVDELMLLIKAQQEYI